MLSCKDKCQVLLVTLQMSQKPDLPQEKKVLDGHEGINILIVLPSLISKVLQKANY